MFLSISDGQVLSLEYNFDEGRLIVKEMADLFSLVLVDKGLVTDSITLHVRYNNRLERKAAHGTSWMTVTMSSARQITAYTIKLYNQIVDRYSFIRRMSLTFNNVI